MVTPARQSDGFWNNLERFVSNKVEHALRNQGVHREPVIEYLRHLEELARKDGDRRQTVQIIASGRSLLGDRSGVASRHGTASTVGGRTGRQNYRPG